LMKSIV